MGLAARCILFLFSVSFLFLVFNLEILGGALHLAGRGREVDVAAVTHDVGSSFLSRFRMLIGLNHRRSRHRRHQISSAAPAPAPTPYQEARSTAPAPLFHSPQKRMPSAHGSHIDPARSAEHKLGDGSHTRLPKAAIVALAVVGACLLVLGVAIAAVSLRRSRKYHKGCSKPFKLFCHGSRAQRSPAATRKVSSHASPDPLYLRSVVQCQENYPNLKQSSESKSLSIISTSPKSTEIIISDHTVKNHNSSQSDEVESFHSVPCSHSSTGSITELPLQICDETMTDASPPPPHTDKSPSDSLYQSFSPDFRSHFSPKSPTFTASSHFNLHNTSHCPEKSDAQEIEVNHHESVKTNDNSGPMEHRNTPKEEEINFKFRNPPSENNSPSYHMDTSPSRTNIALA